MLFIQGREKEKRNTNDNCNPGEVQVHLWGVEAVECRGYETGLRVQGTQTMPT